LHGWGSIVPKRRESVAWFCLAKVASFIGLLSAFLKIGASHSCSSDAVGILFLAVVFKLNGVAKHNQQNTPLNLQS
jgi:hypothetical protein